MKIFKIIKQDLIEGTGKHIVIFLFLISIVLIYLNGAYNFFEEMHYYGYSDSRGTFMDYLIYLFMGTEIHEISLTNKFEVPVYWLGINLFIALSVGAYPANDFNNYGYIKIMYGGGRRKWCISKVIWTILHVITCYAVIAVTTVCFCFCRNIPIRGMITDSIWQFLNENFSQLSYSEIIQMALILPLLTSIVISVTQIVISIILSPQMGYIVVCGLLIASAYWTKEFLFANYLMWIRNRMIDTEGVGTFNGFLINFIVFCVSVMIFMYYMKRCNILNKKESV